MNMQTAAVTLSDCDREPIHTPGSIQPHGAMLICDLETGMISHASANAGAFFPALPTLIGLTLEAAFGDAIAHDLRNAAARAGGAHISGLQADIALPGRADLVDASIHRHENRIFVEIQPAEMSGRTAQDTLDITHAFVLRLDRESTVDAIAATGAKLIRAMLGYDRVMVYRLLHNGAGRVIAEAKKASLASFLGQHFPASDIPHQARRLYLLNTIRAIANVHYAPSPILPPQNAGEAAIDMSYAQLRSVSPIHCEYLRNMGVAASMSISIIVEGELWGLIACHHDTPKAVAMPLRVGAELFGHYFSLQMLGGNQAQAVARYLLAQRRDRGQHTTGEDVLLDKVRIAPVAFVVFLGNRDHLQHRAATLGQAPAQAGEINRPVIGAHRFEHFDGNNPIELAVRIAVILQADVGRFPAPLSASNSRAWPACAGDRVRPVTRQPRSRIRRCANPPQPQPISSTCSPPRKSSRSMMRSCLAVWAVSNVSHPDRNKAEE